MRYLCSLIVFLSLQRDLSPFFNLLKYAKVGPYVFHDHAIAESPKMNRIHGETWNIPEWTVFWLKSCFWEKAECLARENIRGRSEMLSQKHSDKWPAESANYETRHLHQNTEPSWFWTFLDQVIGILWYMQRLLLTTAYTVKWSNWQ